MKIYLWLLLPIISFELHAQEVYIEALPDTRNENSYYTSPEKARDNREDVKTLNLKHADADSFLTRPAGFPNLETLVVNFSGLNSIQSLNNSRNLKSIGIYYSRQLARLPDDITELPQLERIAVSNCLLLTLPPTFFRSKTIRDICLCNNRLFELPEIPVENNITALHLDINLLKTLPDDFKNLQKLEELGLKDCFFTEFPKVILELKNLKRLDLSANKISSIPSGLAELKQLETLFLVRMPIRELPKSLRKSSLKRIHITDVGLSDQEKENICKALPDNCELVWTLELNYTLGNSSCSCVKF